MEQSIFNLFDAINREGIDNSTWGLCQDIADTTSKVLLCVPKRTSRGRVLHLYGHSPLRINQKGETASCGTFRQPQWVGNTR